MDVRTFGADLGQAGVISRKQALEAGLTGNDVRRLLRRRLWMPIHPGVYVDHTGEPTAFQRAWAATLAVGPAALWGPSALSLEGREIHVAIDRTRATPAALDSVVVHHVRDLHKRTNWTTSPPRMSVEAAVIDAAGIADDDLEAIALMGRILGARRTTPGRLIEELDQRGRARRGTWLRLVLNDLAEGACSALEHGYLTQVERPHGLPQGIRQEKGSCRIGLIYRDWRAGSVVVELDGRLFHDNARARDHDFDRDLDGAADGLTTVRLTWGQAYTRPCATAAGLTKVFRRHGIALSPRACSPGCPVAAVI